MYAGERELCGETQRNDVPSTNRDALEFLAALRCEVKVVHRAWLPYDQRVLTNFAQQHRKLFVCKGGDALSRARRFEKRGRKISLEDVWLYLRKALPKAL